MYARSHVLLTFLGTAWNNSETWQFGLRIDQPALPTDAQIDAISNAYNTFHVFSTGTGNVSQDAKFIGVKAAVIGTDGKYPPGAVSRERLQTPSSGGAANTAPQLTIAVTLTTAIPRGLASKGRVYLPPPPTGFLAAADGRMNASNLDGYMTRFVAFLAAVNGAATGKVTVFSNGVTADPASVGPAQVVSGVKVGRVLDTQRRRRSSISEEYISAVVPT